MTNSEKRMKLIEELYQKLEKNMAILDAKLEERIKERQALESVTVKVEPEKK